jgi:hypothetical protein
MPHFSRPVLLAGAVAVTFAGLTLDRREPASLAALDQLATHARAVASLPTDETLASYSASPAMAYLNAVGSASAELAGQ